MLQCAPVSVVIPARNAERYITEAIESVYAQTLPVSELIIIDDGSTDRTSAEVIRVIESLHRFSDVRLRRRRMVRRWASLQPKLIRQTQRGASAARNVGIGAATCDWIAFLDADDVWDARKIELQQEMANRWPAVHFITCDHRVIQGRNVLVESYLSMLKNPQKWLTSNIKDKLGRVLPEIADDFFESRWVVLPSTVMVRRKVFYTIGLFDEMLSGLEDWECFMRILARYCFAVVESPLVRYRLHENNTHRNLPIMEAGGRKYLELVAANPQRYPAGAVVAANLWRVAESYQGP
jgi:glycosyltransferase involved in cell wall biosynthesis